MALPTTAAHAFVLSLGRVGTYRRSAIVVSRSAATCRVFGSALIRTRLQSLAMAVRECSFWTAAVLLQASKSVFRNCSAISEM
jgi:hypothetical protein